MHHPSTPLSWTWMPFLEPYILYKEAYLLIECRGKCSEYRKCCFEGLVLVSTLKKSFTGHTEHCKSFKLQMKMGMNYVACECHLWSPVPRTRANRAPKKHSPRVKKPNIFILANVFNHYHRIKMPWQLTKLSAISAAFFSMTSSLDGIRDDHSIHSTIFILFQ